MRLEFEPPALAAVNSLVDAVLDGRLLEVPVCERVWELEQLVLQV
jgi:hypothetical protein